MAPTAIICLGNRYVPGDDIGCRVFDYLSRQPGLAAVDLFDGGLCGLDLLRLVEGRRRVVFVDAVTGMAPVGQVVVMDRDAVAAYASPYGHGAGLPYLLHVLPQVSAAPLPDVLLAGIESSPTPAATVDELTIAVLAARSVELAVHGIQ